jgi:hypothetical protein
MSVKNHHCLAWLIATAIFCCADVRADVERFFAMVPDDAIAVIVVPDLRNLNDAIVQSLNGMDRSSAIFGSRPIDAIKSVLGVPVAVNERRPTAVVFMPSGEGLPSVEPVWVVPVTNAANFLDGNFTRVEELGNRGDDVLHVRHRHLGELYAKIHDDDVLLAKQRSVLNRWRVNGAFVERLEERLDDAARRTLRTGDIVFWVSDWSCDGWGASIADWLDRTEVERPLLKPLRSALDAMIPDLFADTIVAIDLDPLGLFVRGWSRIDREVDPSLSRATEAQRHLHSLPNKPYQFALALDHRGITMAGIISRRAGWERLAQTLEMLSGVQQLDLAAYVDSPSGVLGQAVANVRSSTPDIGNELRDAMLIWKEMGHQIDWRESASLRLENGVRAHEYDVQFAPDASGMWQLLPPILFGPAGWQGFVINEEHRVAMTFSRARRSADLAAACLGGPERSIADDAVVRSMMGWLPPNPALIWFMNLGSLLEQIRPFVQPFMALMDMQLRSIPQHLPPVAGATATDGGTIEATLIIPAGVLAIGYDLAGERFIRQRLLAPKQERDPRSSNNVDGQP